MINVMPPPFWIMLLIHAIGVTVAVKVLATLKAIKKELDEIKAKVK